jgi:secondary thiamine-phosphate synthase enzyme
MWAQEILTFAARPRGCHLITSEVQAAVARHLARVNIGVLYLYCMHTSCSISINENCDPAVRSDLENVLSRLVPEDAGYQHRDEGPDDMPAHAKSSIVGVSHFIPVRRGKLLLGRWQGIYLCEHRESGGSRQVVLTLQGELM